MAERSRDSTDFEALARQYWGAWGDAMRNSVPGAAPSPGVAGAQAWHDAVDWWTQAVHGGRSDVNDTVGRFNGQARHWLAQMQQVAAQFAGRDHDAAQVARAWKQALGAAGENPFPEMFRGMQGHGLQGMDRWLEDAQPYLGAVREELGGWMKLPQFGFAREHQERAQRLAQAQLEYHERTAAYNALMLKASQSAYERFESKLAEREEPGRAIDSPRALFDLWIDAAEEAYADIALSPDFRSVYGELVNAQMRLRGAIQREVEQVAAQFGMPTRTELDGAHRKIVELERAVRRLRDAAVAAPAPTPARKASAPAAATAKSKGGAKNKARPDATAKAKRGAPAKSKRGATTRSTKPANAGSARTAAPKAAKRAVTPAPTRAAAKKGGR